MSHTVLDVQSNICKVQDCVLHLVYTLFLYSDTIFYNMSVTIVDMFE